MTTTPQIKHFPGLNFTVCATTLPSHTYRVPGLCWPATLGPFTLMGSANRLGAWRWYQRSIVIDGRQITERVKINSQLQPIWDSLVTTHA